MKHPPPTLILAIGLSLIGPFDALAFDIDGSRDLGCVRTGVLTIATAAELAVLPVAGIAVRETKLDLGGVRRYDLSEFDQIYAAAAHRFRSATIAVGLSQLGRSDFYAEQTASVAVGLRRHQISTGVRWSSRRVMFGDGYESLSCMTFGLSAAARWRQLAVSLDADNLTEPRLYDSALPYNDGYTLRLELAGPGDYLLSGRVTLEQRERPRFGLGHRLNLNRGASIYWSIATAPLTFAGGCDIMYSGRRLSYVASYHPTLGLSHLFSIGWTFGGKREE